MLNYSIPCNLHIWGFVELQALSIVIPRKKERKKSKHVHHGARFLIRLRETFKMMIVWFFSYLKFRINKNQFILQILFIRIRCVLRITISANDNDEKAQHTSKSSGGGGGNRNIVIWACVLQEYKSMRFVLHEPIETITLFFTIFKSKKLLFYRLVLQFIFPFSTLTQISKTE